MRSKGSEGCVYCRSRGVVKVDVRGKAVPSVDYGTDVIDNASGYNSLDVGGASGRKQVFPREMVPLVVAPHLVLVDPT